MSIARNIGYLVVVSIITFLCIAPWHNVQAESLAGEVGNIGSAEFTHDSIRYHSVGEDPEYASSGFGPAGSFKTSVQALTCQALEFADSLRMRASNARRFCSDSCSLVCSLSLDSGVLITGLEFAIEDSDTNGFTESFLLQCPGGAGNASECTVLADLSTTVADNPGIVTISRTDLSHTVDDSTSSYAVRVNLSGGTSATSFYDVKAIWKRQVSPAPGTATFDDVPTDQQFFQWIEALVAAGITSGCDENNYCPDQPVTRGQMAVFISKALGL